MKHPLPPAHFVTKRAASQGTSFPLEIEYRELQRVNQDKTEGHECQSAKLRSQRRTTRGGPPPCKTQSLTLRSSRRSRAAIRARKRSLTAVLARRIASLVNLDRALEISSILDRNPRRGQIPHHRPVLLDLNSIARAQIALYVSVNHHLARNHIRCDLGASSHRQLAILQLNQSLHGAVNQQVFVPGDLTLYMQARTQPCRVARTRVRIRRIIRCHCFCLPRKSRCVCTRTRNRWSSWLHLLRRLWLLRDRFLPRSLRFLVSPHLPSYLGPNFALPLTNR